MKTTKEKKEEIDGRKMRWFDCNWNNEDVLENACCICRICRYKNFLDMAGSVGLPSGSTIDYKKDLDEYMELKTAKEKQIFIKQIFSPSHKH